MYVYEKEYIARVYEVDGARKLSHVTYILSQFGTHVLMNPDLSRTNMEMNPDSRALGFPRTLRKGHRVHIYFSYKSPSISDGSLLEFISRCETIGVRKLYIHINKERPDVLAQVKEALPEEEWWRIIFERPSHSTMYRWDEMAHPKTYFVVAWAGIDRIEVWFAKRLTKKEE